MYRFVAFVLMINPLQRGSNAVGVQRELREAAEEMEKLAERLRQDAERLDEEEKQANNPD